MVASPGTFLFTGPLASANGDIGRSARAAKPATSTPLAASAGSDAFVPRKACRVGGSGRRGDGAENEKAIATAAAAPAAAATIRRRDGLFPTRLSAAFSAIPART